MAIRVLVVDDSAFTRKIVSDVLNNDPDIEVVDTAKDGQDALEKLKQHKPDVMTLDVEMPVMNGLECLAHVMKTQPMPVVMLSSITAEGTEATIKALELGAVDFISKPSNIFDIGNDKLKNDIIEKVKIARAAIAYIPKKIIEFNTAIDKTHNREVKKIVAIGTSTGGPKALQQILPLIPGDVPAAFVIVQHMPPGFTRSLANRINAMSGLTVKEADDGDIIQAGYAYIAPGGYHMVFQMEKDGGQMVIRLSSMDPVGGHRPSVDVMMNSLSDTNHKSIIGVIMTGMGADGCNGLKKLKKQNQAFVIAQNQQSCVVYGMPKAAVQAGIVDKTIPLDEIHNEITRLVGV